ncbi:MAG: ATP-dependent RecD-like DNA helicase [Desulfatirhabdiaceae bacterium]
MNHFKPLNPQQNQAIDAVMRFSDSDNDCFILTGSAGTGKTTLLAHLIMRLSDQHKTCRLLAPTGRAARILGAKTGASAGTVHSAIFRFDRIEVNEDACSSNDPGMRFHFPLVAADPGQVIYIVDESSMLSDKYSNQDYLRFGTGRLLRDLIQFTRLGNGSHRDSQDGMSKLIFVGDSAQLPPVGDTFSPALSPDYLKTEFGLQCVMFNLTQVMRQQTGSAILDNAIKIRQSLDKDCFNHFEITPATSEVNPISTLDGIAHVTRSFQNASDESVFITFSNARALELNRAVRGRIWGDEHLSLQVGDLLLVNKNAPRYELYNGDSIRILQVEPKPEIRDVRIKGYKEAVRLVFRDAEVLYRNPDGSCLHKFCKLLENLLESKERDLSPIELRALFVDFRQRHPEIKLKSTEFRIALREDPWFNALLVKYGYAITCHKAQGGEWNSVVVDFNDGRGKRNRDFFRWAYTAITRAKTQLLTVDAPQFSPYSEMGWGEPLNPPETTPDATVLDDDPSTDPDWNRFSFASEQKPLFSFHQHLRDAWGQQGITIRRLTHLQYCERYLITKQGKRATIYYWYKSDFRFSKMSAKSNSGEDGELASLAVEVGRKSLATVPNSQIDDGSDNEFSKPFLDTLRQLPDDTPIRMTRSELMPYRLRVTFEGNGMPFQIDFNFDKTPQWTKVEEVGGRGTSRGFIDVIRKHMERIGV